MPIRQAFEKLSQRIPRIHRVHFFDQTDSTNRQAMAMGKNGAEDVTLVAAEEQSAGRGRRERVWESKRGQGLYFSLLFRPEFPLAVAPFTSLVAGLALQSALKKFGILETIVKWPNDLWLKNRKISGILTEMSSLGNRPELLVVGVGLNLFQAKEDFPRELRDKAASLETLQGELPPIADLLQTIVENLIEEIDGLGSDNIPSLCRRWEKNSGLVGLSVQVRDDNEEKRAKVVGLNAQGHLLVKTDDENILELIHEEITLS